LKNLQGVHHGVKSLALRKKEVELSVMSPEFDRRHPVRSREISVFPLDKTYHGCPQILKKGEGVQDKIWFSENINVYLMYPTGWRFTKIINFEKRKFEKNIEFD
jgi:hypothetical protein